MQIEFIYFLYFLYYFLLIRRVTAGEHRGVGAHAGVLANLPDTGPALVGFPVLAEHQVGVDRQLAGA